MTTIRVPVVGSNHWEGAVDELRGMREGDKVDLEREPTNEYDTNAIRCYSGLNMLGFIPKSHNKKIAESMDSGLYKVTATLVAEALIGGSTDKPLVREPARILVWIR